MAADFAVIIPARNAAQTLARCLDAIRLSNCQPREWILVDDGSQDETGEIARRYGCRIKRVAIGRGPMQARFVGASLAQSGILIFVDADVCVLPDTFSKIMRRFADSPVSALTGCLSRSQAGEGFYTAFKNEYMHYIFQRQRPESTFLYGSLWAIRRSEMLYFRPLCDPFGSLVSDSEMGLRITQRGGSCRVEHALHVRHLKVYSARSLLLNDYEIAFCFGLMLFRYHQIKQSLRAGRLSHTSLSQVSMCVFAGLGWLGLVWAVIVSFWTGLAFTLLTWGVFHAWWSPFYAAQRMRGPRMQIAVMIFNPLDAAVMGLGAVSGLIFALLTPQARISPEVRLTAEQPVI